MLSFSNHYAGTLPNISKLINLQVFNVRNNKLSGSLPNFRPQDNLGLLILSDNQFSSMYIKREVKTYSYAKLFVKKKKMCCICHVNKLM